MLSIDNLFFCVSLLATLTDLTLASKRPMSSMCTTKTLLFCTGPLFLDQLTGTTVEQWQLGWEALSQGLTAVSPVNIFHICVYAQSLLSHYNLTFTSLCWGAIDRCSFCSRCICVVFGLIKVFTRNLMWPLHIRIHFEYTTFTLSCVSVTVLEASIVLHSLLTYTLLRDYISQNLVKISIPL